MRREDAVRLITAKNRLLQVALDLLGLVPERHPINLGIAQSVMLSPLASRLRMSNLLCDTAKSALEITEQLHKDLAAVMKGEMRKTAELDGLVRALSDVALYYEEVHHRMLRVRSKRTALQFAQNNAAEQGDSAQIRALEKMMHLAAAEEDDVVIEAYAWDLYIIGAHKLVGS